MESIVLAALMVAAQVALAAVVLWRPAVAEVFPVVPAASVSLVLDPAAAKDAGVLQLLPMRRSHFGPYLLR